jgi:hypothetical protein
MVMCNMCNYIAPIVQQKNQKKCKIKVPELSIPSIFKVMMYYIRSKVVMAVKIHIGVIFCYYTMHFSNGYHCFKGTYSFHLLLWKWSQYVPQNVGNNLLHNTKDHFRVWKISFRIGDYLNGYNRLVNQQDYVT